MFEQDYQTELSSLREAGRELARRHPALAGMLGEPGADPDVERLLQGFAFLSARLRRRIDDASPELSETLAEWLVPQLVRPMPSATLVELSTYARGMRGALRVPRGARLYSRPLAADGRRCTFTTCEDVDVLPLRIEGCTLEEGARASLVLRFAFEPGAMQARPLPPLRVQVHAEPATRDQLMLWLQHHLHEVGVRDEHGRERRATLRVPPLGASAPLIPWPDFAPQSARLLLEYAALPAKFCHFTLLDLDPAPDAERFELVLRFRSPPSLGAPPPADAFRLHCVPAVNLFKADALPVRVGYDERPQLLRACSLEPEHMEVFSVDRVVGSARDAGRHEYPPLSAFAEHATATGYYALQRAASPVDVGRHTWITLHRSAAWALARPQEVLSVDLTCTNRELARGLAPSELCEPSADLPATVRFKNITPCSAPSRPASNGQLTWQLLGQLAATRRGLSDVGWLRGLLSRYLVGEGGDAARVRTQRARIAALTAVRARTVSRRFEGALVRGTLYQVELDERAFASQGEAHAFGGVLHATFALDARINGFADLELILQPSGASHHFAAECVP